MPSFLLNFSTWVQGILFILIIYHTSAYFFTKDKSFGVYAVYLFLVFIYLIQKTNNESSKFLVEQFSAFFKYTNWIIQVFYWLLYARFSLLFLSIEKKSPYLDNLIKSYIRIALIVSVSIFLIDTLAFNNTYFYWYYNFIYIPTSLIIFGIFLKIIRQHKDKLNTFFVVGLIGFVGFSMLAMVVSLISKTETWLYLYRPINIFILGVLIEAITLSVGLGYKFFLFREEFYKMEHIKSSFENQINELKLASLHNQMNPHFIFNALNSIKLYIIDNNKKEAAYYLTKFSKLIRKILEASMKNEVSLQEELETLKLYLNIENIRFDNAIDLSINNTETLDLNIIKLPPLILQPFVENAIWHGLSTKQGCKQIRINISKTTTHFIKITIEDNGIGRIESAKIKAKKSIKRESVGLKITKDRLEGFVKKLNYNYKLYYEDVLSGKDAVRGTKVTLEIPLC